MLVADPAPQRPPHVVTPPPTINEIVRFDGPTIRAHLARLDGWVIRFTEFREPGQAPAYLPNYWRAIRPRGMSLDRGSGPAELSDVWLDAEGVPRYTEDPAEWTRLMQRLRERPYASWVALHPSGAFPAAWVAEIMVPGRLRQLPDGTWFESIADVRGYRRRGEMLEVRGDSSGVAVALAVLADHYCNRPGPIEPSAQ